MFKNILLAFLDRVDSISELKQYLRSSILNFFLKTISINLVLYSLEL